jgi:hypothetical protein
MKTTEKISDEHLDKIIAVAYGDAGFVDKLEIYFDAFRNPDIKKILNEYRETAREVHLITPEEFDGRVPVNNPKISGWLLSYIDMFFRRPILSTAAALMITAGVAGYIIINSNGNPTGRYSKAELILAEKQARESFAIVTSIMSETEGKLKNDVFNEKINKPISKTITIVNTYL